MSEIDDYNAYQEAVAAFDVAADEMGKQVNVLDGLLAKYIPEPVPPPTISIGQDKTAIVGETVSFSAAVDLGKGPFTVVWNFGDLTGGNGLSTAHAYTDAGAKVVSATVTDALGRTAQDMLIVTVTVPVPPPPPPPATFDPAKAPALLAIRYNAGGDVTGEWACPGMHHAITYWVPKTASGDYSRKTGPTPNFSVSYKPPFSDTWAFIVEPYGPDSSGKIVKGRLSSPLWFPFPEGFGPPPAPPGPGPQPPPVIPLPAPLPPMVRETTDRLLLTAIQLNQCRDKASAAIQQWADFNHQLESQLSIVLQSDYQASHLYWIANYALGYQIFKANYPERAARYADKCIAVMLQAMRDYLKGPKASVRPRVRGDGVTKTFTIPNADYVPSTFRAFLAPISKVTITRGGPITYPPPTGTINADESGGLFYMKVLSVTGADGTVYTEGVDWQRAGDLGNNQLDWSLPGRKPAKGEQYAVEVSSGTWNSVETPVTLVNGGSFEFATAPTKDQTVWVEYMYGTSSADGSTLGYQQTHAGDGGFNTIMIDATYTTRSLLFVALGFAWLEDYAGFSEDLQHESANLLMRWADWIAVNGYAVNGPASNYGASHYLLRVLAGASLKNFDPVTSARLLQAAYAWRTKYVVPLLTNPTSSLKGGWWAEGDNYGPQARRCIILAGIALEQAGYGSADLERQWATESIDYFIHAQPTPTTIYDGGDWFAYPAPLPGNAIFAVLSAFTNNPQAFFYANKIMQRPGRTNTAGWADMLYRDPFASAVGWEAAEPLDHYAAGTGLLIAQSDWSPSKIWLAMQAGNILFADHQSYTPGQLQIQRGGDDLLANANCFCNNQWAFFKSRDGNTIHVNTAIRLTSGDGITKTFVLPTSPLVPAKFRCFLAPQGVIDQAKTAVTLDGASMTFATAPAAGVDIWIDYDAVQDYPGSMGTNYTLAPPTVELKEKYAYMSADFTAAWNARSGGSAVKEAVRQMVFFRNGVAVVYDRIEVAKAEYLKRTQWCSHPTKATAELLGNRFTVRVGSSQMVGETFSSDGPLVTTIKTQYIEGQNGKQPARQISCQQVTPAARVRFCTVFQIGGAGAAALPVEFVNDPGGDTDRFAVGSQSVSFDRGNLIGAMIIA